MLQIWLLYDFYFFVCAYIVAKPYVGTYGLGTIYAHTRSWRSYSNQIAALFTFSVTLCVQKFLANGPRLTKL